MKKLLALMLTLALLLASAACACADTRIVGETNDGHIHCYTADNGQDIYFVAIEPQPIVKMEDVNFDGVQDVVLYTAMGASNAFCEFYVFRDGRYVWARHPGLGSALSNYTLYPERGLVEAHFSNGYAGALHEIVLFRWEGDELRRVRRAAGEEMETWTYENGVHTQTIQTERLRFRVWDYAQSEYEGTVIWTETAALEAIDSGADGVLTREREALWRGL